MTNELNNTPCFASRLNSMGERLDLWSGEKNVLRWIARQGTIKGLKLVDFNSPQHFDGLTGKEVTSALENVSLRTGAVCTRFPAGFECGAFSNPEPSKRKAAINLVMNAGEWAMDLGAKELVVWSAFDGYDYSLQSDYEVMWNHCTEAFRTVCDSVSYTHLTLPTTPYV